MAVTYKVLAQQQVATTGATVDIYTPPAATTTTISSIVISHTAANTSFTTGVSVFVRPQGQSVSITGGNSQLLVSNYNTLAYQQVIALVDGVTMVTGDILTVYVSTANTATIQVFGSEIT